MESYSFTDKGLREINEDSIGYKSIGERSLYIVADGLGGHDRGEVASKIAVETFMDYFENEYNAETFIDDCMQATQKRLKDEQEKLGEGSQMRTTVVCLLVDGGRFKYANVGDSRIYAVQKSLFTKKLSRLSRDHSVLQVLLDTGEITEAEMRFHPDRNRLLRALGSDMPEKFYNESEWNKIDNIVGFYLCSDGAWEGVSDEDILNAFVTKKSATEIGALIKEQVTKHLEETGDNNSGIIVKL
ncbi:MAG: serine/threonine-protein phosphatase [Lachnospiraceae bacterium]|nr:serine/threonine-protein phosphatase [Candidatus Colinaster scatohippi]